MDDRYHGRVSASALHPQMLLPKLDCVMSMMGSNCSRFGYRSHGSTDHIDSVSNVIVSSIASLERNRLLHYRLSLES